MIRFPRLEEPASSPVEASGREHAFPGHHQRKWSQSLGRVWRAPSTSRRESPSRSPSSSRAPSAQQNYARSEMPLGKMLLKKQYDPGLGVRPSPPSSPSASDASEGASSSEASTSTLRRMSGSFSSTWQRIRRTSMEFIAPPRRHVSRSPSIALPSVPAGVVSAPMSPAPSTDSRRDFTVTPATVKKGGGDVNKGLSGDPAPGGSAPGGSASNGPASTPSQNDFTSSDPSPRNSRKGTLPSDPPISDSLPSGDESQVQSNDVGSGALETQNPVQILSQETKSNGNSSPSLGAQKATPSAKPTLREDAYDTSLDMSGLEIEDAPLAIPKRVSQLQPKYTHESEQLREYAEHVDILKGLLARRPPGDDAPSWHTADLLVQISDIGSAEPTPEMQKFLRECVHLEGPESVPRSASANASADESDLSAFGETSLVSDWDEESSRTSQSPTPLSDENLRVLLAHVKTSINECRARV